MRKRTAFIGLSLLLALFSFAEEKVAKPKTNEVVVVAKIMFDPPIDQEFFKNYSFFKVPGLEVVKYKPRRGETVVANPVSIRNDSPSLHSWECQGLIGGLGELTAVHRSMPRNRTFLIENLRVELEGNPALYADLPMMRQVTVPEGVNYIYLGTVTFRREGCFFNIKGFSLTDEYDVAKAWISANYGSGAKLVRANFQELPAAGK